MTLSVPVLAACTNGDMSESFDRTADGSIGFTVGIEASPAQTALTRGDASAASYYAMQAGTQVRLKVDGKWTGKNTEDISQQTTCTTVAATTSAPAVNALSFTESELLYWDDYGTGDPANAANTAAGLKVLGVAVDGLAEAPAVADDEWDSLPWTVITNGENVLNSDIIVSDNLTAYTFADRNDDDAKKMIFVHPLSKITFNLTAADGFTKGTVGATDKKFESDPTLWLSNATTLAGVDDAGNHYALTSGTISISEGKASADETSAAKLIAGTTCTTDASVTVIKQAIVYPGTQLGADDDAVIAVLNADGNIYYIRAGAIHTAMDNATGHTDYKTLPGYNYIFNITVRKSGITLTASVTDWVDVEADEVRPEINMTTSVGGKSTDALPSGFDGFDLYWNDQDIAKGYTLAATPTVEDDGDVVFAETLYWSQHDQHYHFRGIYPTNTEVETDATDGHQYVAVNNGAYDAASFPGNLVMGMPEIAENTLCGSSDHTNVYMDQEGICARNAAINLNFRYMMSQVEVNLTSSNPTDANYVDLTYAEVDLVNIGTEGQILLSDRSAMVTAYADTEALHSISSTSYHGIIVPQLLENTAKGKVQFRITVYSDSTKAHKDVYYATVADIKVKASGSADAAAVTDAWESGTHYVYSLKVTRTAVSASVSLSDWTTVEGSDEVWF